MSEPNWHRAALGEILSLNYGWSLPEKKRNAGPIPVFGSNGIVGFHDEALVSEPGVVIGRKGSAGKVHFSPGPFCPIDTTFFVTQADTPLVLRFLYYLLTYTDLTRILGDVGVPGLNREMAYREKVAFPVEIEEQRKIAAVLSLVQRAIEQQERLIALTAELKKALMRKLFSEGLRGELRKQTEIGPIPESWEVVALNTLIREPLRNGHSATATNDGTGIRTLTLTAVTQRDFSIANTKLTTADPARVRDLWLTDGDILVERANTPDYVGLAALYEGPDGFAIFPDLMIRVRVDEHQIIPYFLSTYLIAPYCRRYFQSNARSTTGNFPKIDQTTVEKLLVPLPTYEEQSAIVELLRQTDGKLRVGRQKRNLYAELFELLLHDLMTAQIRVNELDLSAIEERLTV